jgi:hypothetical protein
LETLYTALFYWARYVEQIGVPVAVSALYFILMKSQPLVSRALASVHGLMFIVALGFVRILGGPGENKAWMREIFFYSWDSVSRPWSIQCGVGKYDPSLTSHKC